ncbi:hypothetical protein PUN28_003588 [Cardiocondyla obscurior]|uniref:Uncharacterized protein n=1 Tax=Cardiocondyla obscurior TaxID=286306 RepID=A0AAW2GK82_9HYME
MTPLRRLLDMHVHWEERQSTFLTGGGPYEKKNQVDSDVLDIIPDLMTTAPTLSFCNISTQQAVEQQREVLKAIQLNCNPTFVMNTASKIRENLETELSEVIYVENTESRPSSQSGCPRHNKGYWEDR